MKTTVEIKIRLTHDPKFPNVITVEMPEGFVKGEGGDIYFSENDGTRFSSLWPAISPLFPQACSAETNGKTEAWIAAITDLSEFDGKTYVIRYTEGFDEDGDFYETAELIS